MITGYNSRITSRHSKSPSKNEINSNKRDQEFANKNSNSNTNELLKNKCYQKPYTTENVQRIS